MFRVWEGRSTSPSVKEVFSKAAIIAVIGKVLKDLVCIEPCAKNFTFLISFK